MSWLDLSLVFGPFVVVAWLAARLFRGVMDKDFLRAAYVARTAPYGRLAHYDRNHCWFAERIRADLDGGVGLFRSEKMARAMQLYLAEYDMERYEKT